MDHGKFSGSALTQSKDSVDILTDAAGQKCGVQTGFQAQNSSKTMTDNQDIAKRCRHLMFAMDGLSDLTSVLTAWGDDSSSTSRKATKALCKMVSTCVAVNLK